MGWDGLGHANIQGWAGKYREVGAKQVVGAQVLRETRLGVCERVCAAVGHTWEE